MRFTELPLLGAYLIEAEQRTDGRGFFARIFCGSDFQRFGLATTWPQVNNSMSEKAGTLRGLHYQRPPLHECKLVRCVRGAVWDVIVDLRSGSPSFGRWFGADLTSDNRKMIYVPAGFAHGYLSLTEKAEIIYACSQPYSPTHEGALNGTDPALGIRWPIQPIVVSNKDANAPMLEAVEPIQV
jgi:dTDP-4-dehydrorhamnose 3,5-epimerase